MFGCPVDEVKETGDGGFAALSDAASAVSLADVAAWLEERGRSLSDEETYSPDAQTFPYGACVAVVEVDRGTGKVSVLRIVAVDDCGHVINPMLVEGQVHGSLLQGVAQAVFEGMAYDDQGQPMTTTLADYPVPTAPDAPRYTTARLVTPAPSNPLGAKGAGESGCIGAPPAVVNAVVDALAEQGVEDLAMPLTPERVWRALHRQ
jgi:carbon-monoxide dehydrogenase large subunit